MTPFPWHRTTRKSLHQASGGSWNPIHFSGASFASFAYAKTWCLNLPQYQSLDKHGIYDHKTFASSLISPPKMSPIRQTTLNQSLPPSCAVRMVPFHSVVRTAAARRPDEIPCRSSGPKSLANEKLDHLSSDHFTRTLVNRDLNNCLCILVC